MSGKISGMVWDLDLPHSDMLVLLAMVDHADHLGRNIRPSIGLIAWKTGYSERQVQRIIKGLVDQDLLRVDRAELGEVVHYRANLSAGKLKPEYKHKKTKDGGGCQDVTPDIAMSEGGVTQLCQGGGDIAMSYKPSIKPSLKTTTPYPLSDDGPGPYGNDWDPAEADQLERYDDADLDDDSLGGGGGDEEDEWDLPATPLKPIERVVIGGLVGGGGEWDAQQYERLAAGGVVAAPQSAPPPTAAPDISWAECEAALGAPEINVQYPGYLRTCGLPYRAIVRKARQLAKGGAGGGAIVKWFKNPENIEALRVELARPVAQAVTAAAEPEGPAPAQLLKQRPAWCSEQAWRGCEPALKVKLQEATQEDGWLWTSSRRQQDAINGKYRNAIIAVLQQSGIQPAPPPPPPAHQAGATGIWGRAAA